MLYLVGLGLGNKTDITLRGFEIIKKCSKVYMEAYTSILASGESLDELEKFYGKPIIIADREVVESDVDEILSDASSEDVCLLVVGDPLGATTHADLLLRAKQKSIPFEVVHNASILNAVGCCGLQLYSYGEVVSIPFWIETWKPDSFLDKILANLDRGLHTLCLLDIKVKEQSEENMLKGRKIYEPPRFMTCAQAAEQLLQIIARRPAVSCTASSICVGLARVGFATQKIVTCTLQEMASTDMGPPLHSLVIVGSMHPIESEMLALWK